MDTSNRDRLQFLRAHVNALADEIGKKGLDKDFVSYIQAVKTSQVEPRAIDEHEWSLLLPAEREANLFAHYHTMRTELMELTRMREAPETQEGVTKWLQTPWVKAITTGATLIKAAEILVHILQHAGLFLRVPDEDDNPLKV
jgi:hypothetical protein